MHHGPRATANYHALAAMNPNDRAASSEGAPWTRRVDRLLVRAVREVRLLGAVTPVGVDGERARIVAAFEADGVTEPRWEYARSQRHEARELLAATERELRGAEPGALAEAYAARIAELDLETDLADAAGSEGFAALARQRFATRDSAAVTAASELAQTWIAARPTTSESATIRSDAPDPRSLLSRMRAAVGERRLPFSVVAHDGLAPLAATGERTILIATKREVTDEDVARTVLHEIDGHALPRRRAESQTIGLFGIGTARGADDQEGYALLLEERGGFASVTRRRQLAARHIAVEAMLRGATFVDATRALIVDRGIPARDAVLAAERAFRGGDGVRAGLGRERVYIESLLRVRARLAARPEDEAIVASGQVAIDAVDAVRAFVSSVS